MLARLRPDQDDARTMTARMKRKELVNPAGVRYRLAWRRSMRICAGSTVVADRQVHDTRGRALVLRTA
jgi:hypothetical protein